MIPLAALKRALKMDADQTAADDRLVELEAAAVAFIERETGRHFGEPRQFTEVIEGVGQRGIWLANEPRSIDSVTLTWTPGGSMNQEVPADFYRVKGRELVGAGGWGAANWPHDVTVVYEAGFDETVAVGPGEPIQGVAAPADIQLAATQLVALWYEVGMPVALGTIAPPVPLTAREIIDGYKPGRA